MKSIRRLFAASAAALLTLAAFAADPAGTWKWAIAVPNANPIQVSLKLELKDGNLAGTYTSVLGTTAISSVSFKDDTLAFSVEREINGSKFTMKYQGKLAADTLKGTIEFPSWNGGEPVKTDWNATRAK